MLRNSSILFSPVRVGPIVLRNRFMRSATWERLADDATGLPTPRLKRMMIDLAAGECGLIIPGYVYPAGTGKSAPCQAGMEYPCHAEAWRDAIEQIHAHGSKVVFQVGDGGVRYVPGLSKAFDIAGISPVLPGTREMTNLELEELIHAFIKSARMLKAVGADGVQIHGAHGYTVSAALSPVMNKRTDNIAKFYAHKRSS